VILPMRTPPGAARFPSLRRLVVLAVALALAGALALGVRGALAPGPAPIRIGAVFPLDSNASSLAGPELAGVRIAADLVNADGGIAGRRIELVVRNLASRGDAPEVMADLAKQGISVVVGSYSSDLSIAASAAADAAGLVYWEAGAVADRLTGRGLPRVFRVGTSGSTLGANSASFAAAELAPRLGKAPADVRVAIAVADDDYAHSVADAAVATAGRAGVPIVANVSYNLNVPNWPQVMSALAAAQPDVIILASHIPDGIAFRQAMVASGLHVGALIGSTMAECDPDFAGDLGADAIGVFASDRPTAGFKPEALQPATRAIYDRFAAAWSVASASFAPSGRASATGGGDNGADNGAGGSYGGSGGAGGGAYGGKGDAYGGGSAEYTITGPAESPTAEQNEEALAGFTAGWALFHDALPTAAARNVSLDAETVAAAARSLDLPSGSLPNGAGLRFSSDSATLGQNERAAAVIWQWQAVRQYAFVWPPTYATGEIAFVPLGR
jgi:branched-chain amino acid transport system substrate-binding protein